MQVQLHHSYTVLCLCCLPCNSPVFLHLNATGGLEIDGIEQGSQSIFLSWQDNAWITPRMKPRILCNSSIVSNQGSTWLKQATEGRGLSPSHNPNTGHDRQFLTSLICGT